MDRVAHGTLVALVLGLAGAGPTGADVLVMRDGAHRAGSLASCGGEQCIVEGKAISRADIAWIGFGSPEALPPPVGEAAVDEIHLQDGETIAGAVTGVSLGVVATDAAEIDRVSVAWIHFAAPAGAVDVPDFLVQRDGRRQLGQLVNCIAESCRFANATLARDAIAWIGLATGEAPVPAAADPAQDAVHLRDGTVEAGRVVAVTAESVNTERAARGRRDVGWVYLAPPATDRSARPGAGPGSRDEPGPEDREPRGPTPPTPPPPPPPPPPGASGTGERGALWSGKIQALAWGNVDDIHSEWTVDIDVRLREFRHPLLGLQGKRVGTFVSLKSEGSTIRNTFTCSGEFLTCSGQGSVTIAASELFAGAIYLNTGTGDLRDAVGFPVPPGGGVYLVGIAVPTDEHYIVEMNGHPSEAGFLSPVLGWIPSVMPGGTCHDGQARTLESGNGKMKGGYSVHCTGAIEDELAVSWSICREGVTCEAPPPPARPGQPGEEKCQPPTAQRGLMDVTWNTRQAKAQKMEADWKELLAAQQEMEFNVEAWRAAIAGCAIVDILSTVVEEAAGDFGKAVSLADKVISGDLSYLIESDDLSAALDVLNAVFAATGPKTADDLRAKLDDCPALGGDLERAANAFVDNWQRVSELMPEVQRQVNDIYDLDEKYWNQWNDYYRRCLEYAECQGTPPADCQPPPAGPGSAMPQ